MGAVDSALSGAASGAAIGSVVPGIGTAVGAVAGGLIGLAPSVFKFFSGKKQLSQANAINPTDPGYQMNQGVIDNARILRDRYNNYTLPGYSQAQNQINNTYQDAYSKGMQGATSGGDVADLAAKLAYGKNIAENNLATQNAQGKDAALGQYMQANAAAGQEGVNANAYARDQYQRQLMQKAALTQAGTTNEYNALETGATALPSIIGNVASSFKKTPVDNSTVSQLGSIFSTYQRPDGGTEWSKIAQNTRY